MRLSYSGLVCLPSKEYTVSSNLISRSTVNAFTKSFLLQLILDTRIGYLGSFFFDILRKFRRSQVIPTMNIVCGRLVTSVASTSMSAIPTGVFRRARVVPTMRILSARLVTSTTTTMTTSTTIPTETYYVSHILCK